MDKTVAVQTKEEFAKALEQPAKENDAPAHIRIESIEMPPAPPNDVPFSEAVQPATDAPVGETVKPTEARLPMTLPALRQSNPRMSVPGTQWRAGKKIMPNAKCPCGSGKKYKKCCSSGC